jgi:ADP-L-glycero-D-manno-heptose 6-epimerase
MPEALRAGYQYHTCANLSRLRALGYNRDFTPLETAVEHYVRDYLLKSDPYR